MDPRGAEAYREGLEHTIEKADELIKTFNALLLVARLEAGALEENAERFDVGRARARRGRALRAGGGGARHGAHRSTSPSGAAAHRQPPARGPGRRQSHRQRHQVFGQDRPEPRPARRSPSACATRDDAIEIAVADRGPGIAPEDRERVLKRFVRLEKSRTEPGTGLGLSLVQAVARLHGGSVRLEDNRPGLRVVLTLPKRPDDR